MSEPTREVAIKKLDTLRDLLEKAKGGIAAVLPQHLTVDRQLKIALMTCGKNKDLLDCSAASILQCVVTASQLGLEPGGPLGHAYLIPFKGVATFIVGYRGLVDLVRRTGEVTSFSAHIVYAADKFLVELGTEGRIIHQPEMLTDPGAMIAVYAVAVFADGSKQFDVMTKAQVDAIRKRSRAAASGPWVTDYDEMAKKTVARRLCKYLPMRVEIAEALETDRPKETDLDYGAVVTPLMTPQPLKGASAATAAQAETTSSTKSGDSSSTPPSVQPSATQQPEPMRATGQPGQPSAAGGVRHGDAIDLEKRAEVEVDPVESSQAADEICRKIENAKDQEALTALTNYVVKNNYLYTLADVNRMKTAATARLVEIEGKK